MPDNFSANTTSSKSPKLPKNLSIPLDFKLLSIVLAVVILLMLAFWKPWETKVDANTRTVKVTGETTISAEPDEFLFNPTYQFTNDDKAAAIAAAKAKENEVVAALKKLEVKDSQIKTYVDGYENKFGRGIEPAMPGASTDGDYVYTLRLTVTLKNRSHAQQVQDYLSTTNPLGSVTPQAQFSTDKRKELESKARDEATRDARAKADQSAKNLGFDVKAVKSVTDGTGFGVTPYAIGATTMELRADDGSSGAPDSSFNVQPGEQDYAYSVSVEYYIK